MLPPSVMGRPASNPADDPMIKLLTQINDGQEKTFGALAKLLSIEEDQLKVQEDSARAEEEAAQAASDAAADAARKTRLQQVAEKGAAAGKKAVETAKNVKKGGDQFVKDKGGLAMTIAKGLGLALAAPAIKEFALNVKGGVEQKLDENGDVISNTFSSALKFDDTGKGSLWAILGGLISKRLILPGFLAGALSEKMKDLDLPISDEAASNIGLAVGGALGIAIPMLIAKGAKAIANKVVTAFKPSSIPTVTPPTTPTPSGPPRPTPSPSGPPRPAGGTGGNPPRPANIPSSMRVNSAGRVIDASTSRFQSAGQVADALKAEGRASTLAKYAKFFKFAGPALAVIPALIDPLMAIYNDAPPDEVNKQIAGALGSVSGATLGGFAGTSAGAALGSGFAVVGAVPGGILGGLAGALIGSVAGERLSEELADYLSGEGPEPSEDVFRGKAGMAGYKRKQQRANAKKKAQLQKGLGGSATTIPASVVDAKVANIQTITQGGGAFGGGAPMRPDLMVNAGGNNTNNTSVGGSSTIFNIVNGGNNSLTNSHLPVPQ